MSARVLALCVLTTAAALPLGACSSEIDNKPAARVSDVPTTESAPARMSGEAASEAAPAAAAGEEQALALVAERSTLEFVGAKLTGDHRGTFRVYGGMLTLGSDGAPSALDIEVDLASLEIEPERLKGHLKSPDFFDVETFPTARFSLDQFTEQASEAGSHRVSGTLELHGVTKQIEFPARIDITPGEVTGSALFTINRQDFGIAYPGQPDDLIKDEVLLDVKLVFARG